MRRALLLAGTLLFAGALWWWAGGEPKHAAGVGEAPAAADSPPAAPGPAVRPEVVERSDAPPAPAAALPAAAPASALDPNLALRVLALDARERAVAQARVFAWRAREGWRELGRTDARGELWIPWESRGEWLDAVGDRARGGAVTTGLAAGDTLRLRLADLAEIRGFTVNAQGVGVPNVVVQVRAPDGGAGPTAAIGAQRGEREAPRDLVLSAADGAFAFLVDPARTYELEAHAPREGWLMLEPRRVRAGDLDVRLPLLAVYAAQVEVRMTGGALHRDLQTWQLERGLRIVADFDEPTWTLTRARAPVDELMHGEWFRSQRHEFAAEIVLAAARAADALEGVRVSGAILGHGAFEAELTVPRLRVIPHVATIVLTDAARARADGALHLEDPGAASAGAELQLMMADGSGTWRRALKPWEVQSKSMLLQHLPVGVLRARLHWPATGMSVPAEGFAAWEIPQEDWFEFTMDLRALGGLQPIVVGPRGEPWTAPLDLTLVRSDARDVAPIQLKQAPAPYAIGGLPPGRWLLTIQRRDAAGPLAAAVTEVTTRGGEVSAPHVSLP